MHKKIQIIGVSGTNGSGKDTVGHILADHHGYLFISVTDLLRAEARKRGQSPGRDTLRTISAEWRRESGLGVLIERAIDEYRKVADQYKGVVIASLRNPGEADSIHEANGLMIWLDADSKIRYDRVQTNAAARDRAEEDNKSFEQFLAEEQAEMNQSGDTATLNMAGVKAKSDIFIDNGHENVDTFQTHLERELGLK